MTLQRTSTFIMVSRNLSTSHIFHSLKGYIFFSTYQDSQLSTWCTWTTTTIQDHNTLKQFLTAWLTCEINLLSTSAVIIKMYSYFANSYLPDSALANSCLPNQLLRNQLPSTRSAIVKPIFAFQTQLLSPKSIFAHSSKNAVLGISIATMRITVALAFIAFDAPTLNRVARSNMKTFETVLSLTAGHQLFLRLF